MWIESFRLALMLLRTHKLRTALTLLSIVLGSFSIVTTTSLAESGLQTLARGIEESGGARLVALIPKPVDAAARRVYQRGLTRDDVELLRARIPRLESSTVLASLGAREVRGLSGRKHTTTVLGADPGFLRTYGFQLERGRGLSPADEAAEAHVCVLGADVARTLAHDAALGSWISVGGDRCQVVGVAAEVHRFGAGFGWEWNDFVWMPNRTLFPLPGLIVFKTGQVADNEITKRIANALLESRHRGVADYSLLDFAGVLSQWKQVVLMLEIMVGFLAGIGLFVGGVGITNILLVSVRERVREIGLRKALGARASDIRRQFLIEAGVLTLIGGTLGAALGAWLAIMAGSLIAQAQPSWVTTVSRGGFALAVASSVGIGLVFGLVPARRAGKLQPVECLRG